MSESTPRPSVIDHRTDPEAEPSAEPCRVRVVYTGMVQGVGFRATVQSVAARHGALGFVRNEPDGSVLAEIQGPREVTRQVLADVAQQRRRFIDTVSADAVPPLPSETTFEIRR